MKRTVAALALAGLVLTSTSCIGGMALSGRVLAFNLDVVKNRWARAAVFVVLYVIPVYPIASMVDLIVVNSLEFHTGTNPVSGKARIAQVGETRRELGSDGSAVVSTLREDGSIDFAITAPDGSSHFVNLEDRGTTLVARDARGRELGFIGHDADAP